MARDANLNRIQAYYPILFLTLTLPATLSESTMNKHRWPLRAGVPVRCPSGVEMFGSSRCTALYVSLLEFALALG